MEIVTKIFENFRLSRIFFKNVLKTFSREEFFYFQKQNVLRDQINTLVDFFWIRLARTILRAIRPFLSVVVTPQRISRIYDSE